MTKHVIVVASGETERRALPHLVSHLRDRDIAVEVRIPPRHRALRTGVAESLIKAAWFESLHNPPDKFVVLLDIDQAAPDAILGPIQKGLSGRLADVNADVLYAYAQQHLESWYFADSANLRNYLGRSPGNVDTSKPDAIHNPKLHLKHLLGKRVYTARLSEEIARRLDPQSIEQTSPSFRGFVDAVRNGASRPA